MASNRNNSLMVRSHKMSITAPANGMIPGTFSVSFVRTYGLDPGRLKLRFL